MCEIQKSSFIAFAGAMYGQHTEARHATTNFWGHISQFPRFGDMCEVISGFLAVFAFIYSLLVRPVTPCPSYAMLNTLLKSG